MNNQSELKNEEDLPVCPHCITPVGPLDHFCPKCAGPISAFASIDPMGQIYSTGRAYLNAVSSRPKRIVLYGMWLIFGPQIFILLILFFNTLSNILEPGQVYPWGEPKSEGRTHDLYGFAVILGFLLIYVIILWKVTSKYFASNTETVIDEKEEDFQQSG